MEYYITLSVHLFNPKNRTKKKRYLIAQISLFYYTFNVAQKDLILGLNYKMNPSSRRTLYTYQKPCQHSMFNMPFYKNSQKYYHLTINQQNKILILFSLKLDFFRFPLRHPIFLDFAYLCTNKNPNYDYRRRSYLLFKQASCH